MKNFIPVMLLLPLLAAAPGCVSRQISRSPSLSETRYGQASIEEPRTYYWFWQGEFWHGPGEQK